MSFWVANTICRVLSMVRTAVKKIQFPRRRFSWRFKKGICSFVGHFLALTLISKCLVLFPNQALLLGFLLAIEEESVRIERATGSPRMSGQFPQDVGPVPPGCRHCDWNLNCRLIELKSQIDFENEIGNWIWKWDWDRIEFNLHEIELNWIERTKERKNARTKERKIERTKQRKKERSKVLNNERKKPRKN